MIFQMPEYQLKNSPFRRSLLHWQSPKSFDFKLFCLNPVQVFMFTAYAMLGVGIQMCIGTVTISVHLIFIHHNNCRLNNYFK
jgi:hypothetical protein